MDRTKDGGRRRRVKGSAEITPMGGELAALDTELGPDRPEHDELAATEADEPVGGGTDDVPLQTVPTANYERLAEIARGGMGRVIRARDLRHGRTVALKEMLAQAGEQRFVREAMITARLQHPSIVPFYEAGRWPDGEAFYAMQYVDGEPLDALLERAQSLDERLAYLPNLIAAAEALAFAHSKKVIHRDFKPANVLIGAFGETIVVDWGLARELADDDSMVDVSLSGEYSPTLTAAGQVLGTPVYSAPEQLTGDAVDARVDVYALGATLYQLLAGRVPYADVTTFEQLRVRVLDGNPEPIADLAPDAPRELITIAERALAGARADRYRNASELVAELRRYHTGQLVTSHRYTLGALVRRWLRRHRAVVAATALFATLACAGLVWFLTREQTLRHDAEHQRNIAEDLRSLADTRLAEANDTMVALLVEQGRIELLAGHPDRAAVYLSEAYSRGEGGVEIRALLADAMRPYDDNLATLEGHTDRVRSVEYDPAGRRLITASQDKTARIWNAATGAALATLEGHSAYVYTARFSPDGERVVTASFDKTARIWSAADGRELGVLEGHTDRLLDATFSPDGARIATTGFDGTVIVWDAATREQLASIDSGSAANRVSMRGLARVRFTRDGTRVITAGRAGAAVMWDIASGRPLLTFAGHERQVWTVELSPDETRLITASEDHTARIWDAATGELLATLDGHASSVMSAAFDASGERIVTAGDDYVARIWNASTGRPVQLLEGHDGAVLAARFNPAGDRVATASADNTVRIWRVRPVELGRVAAHEGAVTAVAYGAGGHRIVTAGEDDVARVWDARTLAAGVALTGHTDDIMSVDISRDESRVATGAFDGTARIWDATTGDLLHTISAPEMKVVFAVAFSPDGRRVATGSQDATLRVWDVGTGALERSIAVNGPPVFSVCFDELGQRIAAATAKGDTVIVDSSSGEVTTSLGDARRAVFTPSSARIVTVPPGRAAQIRDATTGDALLTLDGHTDVVISAAASPDGERIATASVDQTMRTWSATSGLPLAVRSGHATAVTGVAFGPDSNRAVTTGADGALIMWDIHVETRTPEAIAAIVAERARWRIDGAHLVPR